MSTELFQLAENFNKSEDYEHDLLTLKIINQPKKELKNKFQIPTFYCQISPPSSNEAFGPLRPDHWLNITKPGLK